MLLHSGNVVKTEADGSVDLMLDDTKAAGLDVGSKAAFEQEGKQLKINVEEGLLYFYTTEKLGPDETCDIETQTMVVGIYGTVVEMFYDPQTGVTELTVPAGQVEVTGTNPTTQGQRTQTVRAGQRVRTCFFNNEVGEKSILFTVEDVSFEDLNPLTQQKIVENPTTLQEVAEQNGWSESQMQASAASVQTVNASVPGSNESAGEAAEYRQEASSRAEQAVFSSLEEALQSDIPAIRAAAQALIDAGYDDEGNLQDAEGEDAEGEDNADQEGADGADAGDGDDNGDAEGGQPAANRGGVNADSGNANANAADADGADAGQAAPGTTNAQTNNTITTTSDGIQVSGSSSSSSSSSSSGASGGGSGSSGDSSGSSGGSSGSSGSDGSSGGSSGGSSDSSAEGSSVVVTGISLSQTAITLEKGKSQTVTATVTPENAINKTVTWKSSNTSIATVSDSGVITAGTTGGEAVITATTADGGYSATCTVTVPKDRYAINISVSSDSNGTVTASVNGQSADKAAEGDTVILTLVPQNSSYHLMSLEVNAGGSSPYYKLAYDVSNGDYVNNNNEHIPTISGASFSMPDTEVTVSASFFEAYTITVKDGIQVKYRQESGPSVTVQSGTSPVTPGTTLEISGSASLSNVPPAVVDDEGLVLNNYSGAISFGSMQGNAWIIQGTPSKNITIQEGFYVNAISGATASGLVMTEDGITIEPQATLLIEGLTVKIKATSATVTNASDGQGITVEPDGEGCKFTMPHSPVIISIP